MTAAILSSRTTTGARRAAFARWIDRLLVGHPSRPDTAWLDRLQGTSLQRYFGGEAA